MAPAAAWLGFVACALAIALGGVWLTRYGHIIAEKTGMGGTWVGLVLLATVTSLPELVTGISSVTIADAPNIAVGDALGSCVFNLAIVSVLDWLHRGESLFDRADQGHLLSAAFGVMLLGFVAFNLLVAGGIGSWSVGHVGLYTPIILVFYLLAMRVVFLYEKRELARFGSEAMDRHAGITLAQALVRYALASVVVLAAGTGLPFVGKALAAAHGWHASFVGTLLVAFATSLPELVVTIAALRIGAIDMAIANLLGSNLFDVAIIAVDDLFYAKGPILAHVTQVHAVSALSAIVMTGAFVAGFVYRSKSRVFGTVGWASLFLFLAYLLNAYLLFLHGA